MKFIVCLLLLPVILFSQRAENPVLHADIPDLSMIRVGNTYYMSSTTNHMSPGIPIMKSTDLVNWKLVNYAYDTLANVDDLNLVNGKSTYGWGSWASSLRYQKGTYYVTTFAGTTKKTYIYSTKDIERGPWKRIEFSPMYHDHTLHFDEDGKTYMIYGGGTLKLVELKPDLSGPITDAEGKPIEKVIIENASAPAGNNIGLPAEGSQLFKVKGKYYLFNITWPKGGMRTVVIHRADKLTGPWEGKLALQDKGVAQGGLISTPAGKWYSYLFRDNGSVGRIPYLVPVKWEDGWPVIGIDGKVPMQLDLPAGKNANITLSKPSDAQAYNKLIPGIVTSDEFTRAVSSRTLPLPWQWNHNPDNKLWSVYERKGFLRLKTGRIDTSFLLARNSLTQRTFGPQCSASTSIDISNLKDGDFAGLGLLQQRYGLVGVRNENGKKYIVMVNAETGKAETIESVELKQARIYVRADCDFRDLKDVADFYYSLDGKNWTKIGSQLKMAYTIPQFIGYRFALFNYATKEVGGYADFDWYRIR
ncbi:MAG: glycoside hydrolase 43 family protein [Flavitalea sp.]